MVMDHRTTVMDLLLAIPPIFFAFALFASLVLRNRLFTIASFITAATVAYSRIYLGVHFITDAARLWC